MRSRGARDITGQISTMGDLGGLDHSMGEGQRAVRVMVEAFGGWTDDANRVASYGGDRMIGTAAATAR